MQTVYDIYNIWMLAMPAWSNTFLYTRRLAWPISAGEKKGKRQGHGRKNKNKIRVKLPPCLNVTCRNAIAPTPSISPGERNFVEKKNPFSVNLSRFSIAVKASMLGNM